MSLFTSISVHVIIPFFLSVSVRQREWKIHLKPLSLTPPLTITEE